MTLHCEELGAGSPVVILHGLFGAGRNWRGIANRLARHHRVLLPDMRSHGRSPGGEMTYAAMAGDVAGLIRRRCGGRAAVVGHSMGGKAAMALALEDGRRVSRLAVADIAPVARGRGLRAHAEAMRSLPLERIGRRGDADAWLVDAVPDAGVRGFLLRNLEIDAEGARWRLDLEALLDGMEAIAGWPDHLMRRSWPGPALFLLGGRSGHVGAADVPHIHRHFPAARLATVPEAGHWLHAERPDLVAGHLEDFLAEGAVG